jgi:PAS domain S-box-containing protein
MNMDDRVVRVNREFTRLFGYTPQEALGRHLSELIVPSESREEEQQYLDLVAKGQRVDVEGVRQRKDGMQERALIVGGQITIKSTPGHGTEVKARFPLPPPRALESGQRE